MSCNCNKPTNIPCGCEPCEDTNPGCSCPIKDLSTDCVLYTGDRLSCSGIETDTVLTDLIVQLDKFICDRFNDSINYTSLVNIGVGAEVYRGISGAGQKEIRSIIKSGNLITVNQNSDNIEISLDEDNLIGLITDNSVNNTYTVNNLSDGVKVYKDNTVTGNNTQFNLRTFKSDTLTIIEEEGHIQIDIPSEVIGLRLFYVNNNYTGTEEVGTIAKPYKTIQNALVAYTGTGTKDAPEFLNSKVIVQTSTSNYVLDTDLNIRNLDITLEEDVVVVYVGPNDYMLDSREFLPLTNTSNKFRGEGLFRVDDLKGFVYNQYTTGVDAKSVNFYDNVSFQSIHTPLGQTITDVPQTVGGTDYYPSVSNPSSSAVFFVGDSMQRPLFVFKQRNPQNINGRIYGKLNITTITQTPIVLEDNAYITTLGSETTSVNINNSSGVLLIDGVDNTIPVGQPNVLLPSTTFNYLCFNNSSIANFAELNFGIGGTNTRIKELVNFKATYTGTGLNVSKGLWRGIEESLACVNFENGGTGRVVLSNVVAGNCRELTIRNESSATHTLSTINNCVFNRKIDPTIDLTRGNAISVENRIEGRLNRRIVGYPSRTLATSSGNLAVGDIFINTNNNDTNTSNHFLDIIV